MGATFEITDTFEIHASFEYYKGSDFPQWFEFSTPLRATMAEAEADVAQFPKSSKLKAYELRDYTTGKLRYYARISIKLRTDGTNGGVNETGIKRMRAIYRVLDKQALPVQLRTDGANYYQSREAFEAGLAAQAAR